MYCATDSTAAILTALMPGLSGAVRAKDLIRAITPPVVYEAAGRIKNGAPAVNQTNWKIGGSWIDDYPPAYAGGVDGEDAAVRDSGITYLQDSPEARLWFLAFAYIVSRVARGKDEISILDFGGALGSYSLIAERAAPETRINYTVVERKEIAAAGRSVRPTINFETSIPDRRFDLCFASGSLQYIRNWHDAFTDLSNAGDTLFVSRCPVLSNGRSTIAHQSHNGHSIASWFLSRRDIDAAAVNAARTLVEHFLFAPFPMPIAHASEIPYIEGFWFT